MAGRLRIIRSLIVDGVNDPEAATGVHAYRKLPNRYRFPAFLPEPANPAIKYLEVMDRGYDATYHFDGWVFVPPGPDGQDQVDDLIAPDSALIQALDNPELLVDPDRGIDGRLFIEEAGNYGELEIGTKPQVAFGARLVIRVEL